MADTRPPALLTLRATVILTLSALIGGIAGLLIHLAGRPIPEALFIGGAAAGSAMITLNKIISAGGDDDPV